MQKYSITDVKLRYDTKKENMMDNEKSHTLSVKKSVRTIVCIDIIKQMMR